MKEDVASGKVKDVEVVDHDDLMKLHDERVSGAQERYEGNPTQKNADRLERAQRAQAYWARDRELLIKGTVASEYVTPPGGTPAGAGSPTPAAVPGLDDPSQRDDDE